jgi:transposase
MFFPEGQIRVYVYGRPVDMRRSYDGLYALVRNAMGQDPLSGHLFAFINRRGTQMKILYFDRTGFCIWGKRLEAGCFVSNWQAQRDEQLDYTGLKLLLEGVQVKGYRKRYARPRRCVNEYAQSSSAVEQK